MIRGFGRMSGRVRTMSIISVSIVTFNTWDDAVRCVKTVLATQVPNRCELEILLHDNGLEPPSHDIGVLTDDRVRLTRSHTNLGFAQGHNRNLALARGDFFLILNPDCRPERSAVAVLMEKLMTNGELGAVAPQLLNEDGSVQPSCRRFPRLRYEAFRAFGLDRLPFPPFSSPLMRDWSHDSERIVDQPAGAALMVRTEDLRQLGGLAEEFPIYFEDVDLCRRIHMQVGPILFTPEARVWHGREGTAGRFRKETTFWLEWSRRIYYKRLGATPATRLAVRALSLVTSLARMTALFLRGLLGPESPAARDARAKALGYGLVLATLVYRDEARWRRSLLHP